MLNSPPAMAGVWVGAQEWTRLLFCQQNKNLLLTLRNHSHLSLRHSIPSKPQRPVKHPDGGVVLKAVLEGVLANGVYHGADHSGGGGWDPGQEGLQPARHHLGHHHYHYHHSDVTSFPPHSGSRERLESGRWPRLYLPASPGSDLTSLAAGGCGLCQTVSCTHRGQSWGLHPLRRHRLDVKIMNWICLNLSTDQGVFLLTDLKEIFLELYEPSSTM